MGNKENGGKSFSFARLRLYAASSCGCWVHQRGQMSSSWRCQTNGIYMLVKRWKLSRCREESSEKAFNGKIKRKSFRFLFLLLSLSCSSICLCREKSLPQQIQIIIKKLFVLFCRFVVFPFQQKTIEIHVGMWIANDIEAHIRAREGSVANMNGISGVGGKSKRQQKLKAIHEHVLFGREKHEKEKMEIKIILFSGLFNKFSFLLPWFHHYHTVLKSLSKKWRREQCEILNSLRIKSFLFSEHTFHREE